MSYEIVKADKSDAAEIAMLERQYIEVAWTESQIVESMDSGLYDFYVCKHGGKIIAYGFLQWCLDEGNICNIATHEQFRNRGIAACILSNMVKSASERGAARLLLEVSENNQGAISLYTKAGFEVLYKRNNYYGSVAALVMERKI